MTTEIKCCSPINAIMPFWGPSHSRPISTWNWVIGPFNSGFKRKIFVTFISVWVATISTNRAIRMTEWSAWCISSSKSELIFGNCFGTMTIKVMSCEKFLWKIINIDKFFKYNVGNYSNFYYRKFLANIFEFQSN